MKIEDIRITDGSGEMYNDDLSQFAVVHFDVETIATALDVTPVDLMGRMLRVMTGAFAMEAVDLAQCKMRETGQILGRDGWPDGWPNAYLCAVVQMRLFPERTQ